MKFVKLFSAVFLFLLLFASSFESVKAALPMGPLPPCGPTAFYESNGFPTSFQKPLTEIKQKQVVSIQTKIDSALNLPTNKTYFYLNIVNNNLRGLAQTPGVYKNGEITAKADFDKASDPGQDALYLINEDGVKSGNLAPICVTNSIKVLTSNGTTIETCIPGATAKPGSTPTPLPCGDIPTAFGELSGNPGNLASLFYGVALGLGGGVALLIMIFASIKMISSRGDPDALQSGRQLFTSAIIGLLVIVFAAFLIRVIGTGLGIPGISLRLHTTAYAVSLGGYQVPDPAGFKFSNSTLGEVVSASLQTILFFAGVFAFAFLVFGGFKYLISRGDPKAVASARSTISFALLGLAIIVGSYLIIQILKGILKLSAGTLITPAYADVDLGTALGVKVTTFGELFSRILAVVLPIGGIVFFFMLLWGGLRYLISRGDDKAVMGARSIITSALIGLLIILGSYLILKVIEGITGIHIIG